jgi:hypothetical protein
MNRKIIKLQLIQFELMEHINLEEFDSKRVVSDLIKYKDLWGSVCSDRSSRARRHQVPYWPRQGMASYTARNGEQMFVRAEGNIPVSPCGDRETQPMGILYVHLWMNHGRCAISCTIRSLP